MMVLVDKRKEIKKKSCGKGKRAKRWKENDHGDICNDFYINEESERMEMKLKNNNKEAILSFFEFDFFVFYFKLIFDP